MRGVRLRVPPSSGAHKGVPAQDADPATMGWQPGQTAPTKADLMDDYERRCRQALYALHLMRGTGVIDLNRIQHLLDPDGSFLLPATSKGDE